MRKHGRQIHTGTDWAPPIKGLQGGSSDDGWDLSYLRVSHRIVFGGVLLRASGRAVLNSA